MNWITKFFGQNGKAGITNKTAHNGAINDPATLEEYNLDGLSDLFVDPNPPVDENIVAEQHAGGRRIESFLDQDFYRRGYSDGYQYHTQDILDNRVRSIKADFRLQLDQSIDQKRRELLNLEMRSLDVEGLSERILRRIEATADDFRAMIARLELEKELSASDEGWVMKVVHSYRDGFIRGLEEYNELRIFGINNGLFH